MIYFISDLHFGHSNILKFERYEFNSIEEHDSYIMHTLERTLHKDDVLYHLGDFGFPSEDIVSRWKELSCKKIGIAGNHDIPKNKYEKFFDEYYTHPIYITKRIVLSHEPIKCNDDCINVHGHLHASTLNLSNHVCVSAYMVKYRPMSLKMIDKLVMKMPKESSKYTEEWYAPLVKYCDTRISRNKCVFPKFDRLKRVELSIDGDRYMFAGCDISEYGIGNVYKTDYDMYFTHYFFLTLPNVFGNIDLTHSYVVFKFCVVDTDGNEHFIYNDYVNLQDGLEVNKDFVKFYYNA